MRSMSFNTHAPRLISGGTTAEADGPRYDLPPENEIVRIDFGDGQTAGESAQRLFQERKWPHLYHSACFDPG